MGTINAEFQLSSPTSSEREREKVSIKQMEHIDVRCCTSAVVDDSRVVASLHQGHELMEPELFLKKTPTLALALSNEELTAQAKAAAACLFNDEKPFNLACRYMPAADRALDENLARLF